MKNLQDVLKEYRGADDERRLYLFLQYRCLRRHFVRIDFERYQSRLHTAAASAKKPAGVSFWRRMRAGFAFDKL